MWRHMVVLAAFFAGQAHAAEPVTIRFAAPPGILSLIDVDFVGTVNRQLEGIARIVLSDAGNSLSKLRENDVDIALIPSSALANSRASGLALFDSPFQF